MINFLHTNIPEPILVSFGPLKVYWYGVFIVLGILVAITIIFKLVERYNIKKDTIIDSVFWLVISGIIGARLYSVFLDFSYYQENPLNIFKIWQGGLAIHGAIIAGLLMAWFFAKKHQINYWLLLAIATPGVAIAQAIGRWGNYFNQELFGKPTSLAWGIPIEPNHRILEFYNSQYFHPTFLYESLGNLIIFFVLIGLHLWIVKNIYQKNSDQNNLPFIFVVIIYLTLYSLLRFSLEFIRVDTTIVFMGLRWPQVVSLIILIINSVFFYKNWPKLRKML